MSATNTAAWLQTKQATEMIIDKAPYPSVGPKELIIRTKAVAINPADNLIQQAGVLLTEYPAILGCDAAGIVEQVGSELASTYKLGDRVIGQTGPISGYRYSSFQDYVVLKMPLIAKIPDNVSFSDAVVLPLGITTAASCLFGEPVLNLGLPPSNAGNGKTLIIWGASGSVGCCGLQLAVAAGYEVFALASSRNHDFLKSVGATQCFDYRDENLVESIVQALDGKDCVGAMDAISSDQTLHTLCMILSQATGARKFIASIMPGADQKSELDVTIETNFSNTAFFGGLDINIWQGFLGPAMKEGRIRYVPGPEVVGHGLGEVQRAMTMLAGGVSAKKLVVTI